MPIRTNSGTESDLAVDELKRRARRRLVGAVVLALAAAVILPLLLESDPKPLGDDVSIKIPPVDSGRFVNPLSPDKSGAPGASDAKPGPPGPSTPRKSIAEAERRVLGQPAASAPPAPAPAPATPTAPPATAPVNVPVAPLPSGALGKVEGPVKSAPAGVDPSKTTDAPVKADEPAKSEPPATTTGSGKSMPAPASDANAKPGGSAPAAIDPTTAYSVQVGAFVDAKSAADLAGTLKRGGFSAYTEGVATAQGTVQRVRVGPFATKAAADAGLAKLKAAGFGSAVVKSPK
jgi:DedD protein